jgi:uncharacterized protein (TIGR02444 family)
LNADVTAEARAWDFAVRRYGEPGVAAACLALQDAHGQCVSLLLWRAWTLGEGLALGAETLAQAVAMARTWDGDLLRPLRAARRRAELALPGIGETARGRLREGLLQQELGVERALIEALARLAAAAPTRPPPAPHGAAGPGAGPLAALARLWGEGAPDDLLAKVGAA